MWMTAAVLAAALASETAGAPAQTALPTRLELLDEPVEPTKQEVHLVLDPAQSDYRGKVEISLSVDERLRSFHLHSQDLVVSEAAIVQGERRIEAKATPTGASMLEIEPGRPLKPGSYVLELSFSGKLRDSSQAMGLYVVQHEGRSYLTSQLEPTGARTAWPCFDEPVYKVPLQLSLELPPELLAVSNAPVDKDETDKDGKRTVTFETTKPIPSYAWALSVGPYAVIEVPDMPVPTRVLALEGRQAQAATVAPELPPLLRELERWFGEPYPYEKLDIVAIPEFAFGAMENPGAIVLNEVFLADRELSTPAQRKEMLHVLAHELGHMWFGNLVTLAWWDDFWLNESFAEWVSRRAVEGVYPELAMPMEVASNTVQMLQVDARASTRPMRTEVDPLSVFETVNFAVYRKGTALLDTTEAWLGPDVFRAGVRRYLGTWRWSTATAEDLFSALGIVAGLPVRDTLQPWLDRPGAPSLSFSLRPDGRVQVLQQRFLSAGSAVQEASEPWPVPLRMRVGRPGGGSEIVTALVSSRSQALELGPVAWLMPAADGLGYFTFTLSGELDQALLQAAPGLPALERLRLVAATRHGFLAGSRSTGDVLRTLEALNGEKDPQVIEAMLQTAAGLVELARDLEDPQLTRQAEAWLAQRARRWLEALGPAVPGEPAARSTARDQLVGELAEAGDAEVRAQLRQVAETFLADPTAVPLDTAQRALSVAAEQDQAFGLALRERARAEQNPALRRAMLASATRAGGPEQRREMLDWALASGASLPDLFAVWSSAMQRRADRDLLVDWQMEHHEALISSLPTFYRPRLLRVAEGCRAERLERVKAFYTEPSRALPGTERVLREMEDTLRICRALADRHGAELAAAFSAQASR